MPSKHRRSQKTVQTNSKPPKPIGVKGMGKYERRDSRQPPPEEMFPWASNIYVYSIADIPLSCQCTWAPRTGGGIVRRWELKFSYALCPARHPASPLASAMPA